MKLVVVESPAKAKTIEKYLGPGHRVLASFGHVRDLPPKDGSVDPDKAFEMLKAWHRNISNYPRTGVGPVRAASRGETTIAVTFMHDAQTEIANGFPVKIVAPCEGTGYEVGSMSIVKGARNLENAKKFYDWALTPAAQKIGGDLKNFQLPSNKSSPIPPGAPKLSELKLINYDFAKYGSATERKRLLEKWDREVSAQSR